MRRTVRGGWSQGVVSLSLSLTGQKASNLIRFRCQPNSDFLQPSPTHLGTRLHGWMYLSIFFFSTGSVAVTWPMWTRPMDKDREPATVPCASYPSGSEWLCKRLYDDLNSCLVHKWRSKNTMSNTTAHRSRLNQCEGPGWPTCMQREAVGLWRGSPTTRHCFGRDLYYSIPMLPKMYVCVSHCNTISNMQQHVGQLLPSGFESCAGKMRLSPDNIHTHS